MLLPLVDQLRTQCPHLVFKVTRAAAVGAGPHLPL